MKLGQYELIRCLGKGGMGEVFLAHDDVCKREVALKQIKPDLLKYESIRKRFLREAHLAAKLIHPSIIPIFSIHQESDQIYYTMPYVEGETLREMLRKKEASLGYLIRIFWSVCQGIAYSHSKGILHRDIKAENIIVGKFGEVMILDWGLAQMVGEAVEETEEIPSFPGLTIPGKIVGTVSYMAPERAKGEAASEQTDLYSLGVLLYFLLTLKLPFKRGSLKEFQQFADEEEWTDPVEKAPHRDIPRQLSEIVKKSLSPSKETRYKTVVEMLADLETYIEGKPEWILANELKIEKKGDWEFQENVLLAKHIALTRTTDVMEWVSLMVSKDSFSGNTKLEAKIRLKEGGSGIGFLLNIPEVSERKDLMDGYCLWLGSSKTPGTVLFRSNIEVMRIPGCTLSQDTWNKIRIEKIDNRLRFYFNDTLKCHYISHTPLAGTLVGLLHRDADFEIQDFNVYIGSQNVMVSCLAVPDAFLASKEYARALSEYRRIASSFVGRAEGREALFRAGITLLEGGILMKKTRLRDQLYSMALEEFGKLRATAGAPLEYLGKSLVYKALGEVEEEVKCLELAIRKFAKHPLRPRLIEHIVFRMHESSQNRRLSAYHFALLALRQLPEIFDNPDHRTLLESLQKNWEDLPFLKSSDPSIRLAFWLAKPITLMEIVEEGKHVEDAHFCLSMLGCEKLAYENPKSEEDLLYLFYKANDKNELEKILPTLGEDELKIWALLKLKKFEEAGAALEKYPLEVKTQETSPLYPLFGCYLYATEGEQIAHAHFSGAVETPYPRTHALLGHFLTGKLGKKWFSEAFFWEKAQLYRHLALLHTCLGEMEKAAEYEHSLKKEMRRVLRR